MADKSQANLPLHLDRSGMHCTTHMHMFLIKSIHLKPSVTFSAIPHTKFHLQCKIWDKFFVRYSYPLEKSRNALEINWQYRAMWTNWMTNRARTLRQYTGQWCQLSVKKDFDNLFKRAFWMIHSRYFFDRMFAKNIRPILKRDDRITRPGRAQTCERSARWE